MDKGYYLLAVAGLLATVYAYQNRLTAQGHSMKLTSTSFEHNKPMNRKYTHYGQNIAPQLAWHHVPEGAQSLALIIEDPDAPTKQPFVHAIVYNIDPQRGELKEGSWDNVLFGMTDFNKKGYQGPKPPKGHGIHRYIFKLYALDSRPDFPADVTRQTLESMIKDHILASTELIGTYIAS